MSWLGQAVGPYQIVRAIGAGGMGEVYEAAHARLAGKRYAIKILSPALVAPSLVARFRREAEILARLRHPGIVAVHDFDTTTGGAVYLAMDLLEGEDLAARLGRGLPNTAAVARIVADVVEALDAAHAAGVVHRDLKPANIFLRRPDDRAVVLDFGVAKDTSDPAALTKAGELFGTPAYMSPEQASGLGDQADARTDVFALAAIVFEMLAGVPAFAGPSVTSILHAITTGPRPDLRAHRPDLPAAIAAVIDGALAIDKDQRTASVREFGAALAPLLPTGGSPAFETRPDPTLPPIGVGTEPTMAATADAPMHLDDNVQFTAYRPKVAAPEIWQPMVAFAHLAEKAPDAAPSEPDPIEEVRRQAAQVLGEQSSDYASVTQDSRQAVPREGELTFVPEVLGLTFNPRTRSFLWLESVHREEFRFKAAARLAGSTARGRLTVYLGRLILAEISLAIRVGGREQVADIAASEASHARPFRKIYASYASADEAVVREMERYAATGDVFVRDAMRVRAGETFSDEIGRKINDADLFQLFWSTRSMRSPLVRAEWEYALSLDRPGFLRPTYWEEPMPADPSARLPPPELAALKFERLVWSAAPTVPPTIAPTLPAGAPVKNTMHALAPDSFAMAPGAAPMTTSSAWARPAPAGGHGKTMTSGFSGAAPPTAGAPPGIAPVQVGAPDGFGPRERKSHAFVIAIALVLAAVLAIVIYLLAS